MMYQRHTAKWNPIYHYKYKNCEETSSKYDVRGFTELDNDQVMMLVWTMSEEKFSQQLRKKVFLALILSLHAFFL